MLFSSDNRPAPQATAPTFPGSYASLLQGQQGGQIEMQAHGLSPGAGNTANILSGPVPNASDGVQTNRTASAANYLRGISGSTPSPTATSNQELQGSTSNTASSSAATPANIQSLLQSSPFINWQQLFNPLSILSMLQQPNVTPQSIFSLNNQQAWQNAPGQA